MDLLIGSSSTFMIYVLLPESICFDAIADYVDSKKNYFYVQKTHFSEKKTFLPQQNEEMEMSKRWEMRGASK